MTNGTLVWAPPLCSNQAHVEETLSRVGLDALRNPKYVGSLKAAEVNVYLK